MNVRTIILCLASTFCVWSLEAQNPQLHCGTAPVKSDWLKEYQKSPWAYATRSQERLTVPLTVHIVGTDEGTGYYSKKTLLNDICKLNQDFDQVNIQYYIRELNYLDNTSWYDHNFHQGRQMMDQNNVPGSVNCYIVSSPAGNCGYYSSREDAIALNKGCLGGNGTTWTHELGHFFSLPHTFLGWEGRDYDPDEPTPTTVGQNNRAVEFVDGSNCQFAADGFCDTGPDYLSYRWDCNSNAESNVVQYDPDNEQFRSDGTFFMSYSSGSNCRSEFSDEQIDAMRANILDHRPGLPENQVNFDWDKSLTTRLTHPVEDTTVQYDDFTLRWEKTESAEYYVIKLNRFASLPGNQEWIVEQDTFLHLEHLNSVVSGVTYYWQVTPYSLTQTCIESSQVGSFKADNLSASEKPNQTNKISIHPNPADHIVRVQFNNRISRGVLQIQNINGQILSQWKLNQQNSKQIPVHDYPEGIYFLTLQSNDGVISKKIVVK